MPVAISFASLFLAFFLSSFLFWRACIHELHEPELAFDTIIVAVIGALAGARILDFVSHINEFGLSFSKLVFFNSYGGFDFYGGLLGAGLAVYIFLRRRRVKVLSIFDLAAAPIVFSQVIFYLLKSAFLTGDQRNFYAVLAGGNLLIFIILKRLATKKRHFGFFISFYIVIAGILNLASFLVRGESTYVGKIPYHLAVFGFYLIFGLVFWYKTSKRSIIFDIKNIFAQTLLSIFRARRVITSANEAGTLSRSVILAPMFVAKSAVIIIKLAVREVRLGFLDLLYVLGLRHDRY